MRIRRKEYVEPLNINIKIVSWNVNGKRITEDLTSLFHEDVEPGIYVIGYLLRPLNLHTVCKKWI
jgi:hypothetical protein